MFGDSILVVPKLKERQNTTFFPNIAKQGGYPIEYYIPQGTWYDYTLKTLIT